MNNETLELLRSAETLLSLWARGWAPLDKHMRQLKSAVEVLEKIRLAEASASALVNLEPESDEPY